MFSQKEKLDKRNLSFWRAWARFALSCLGPTGSSQQYMGQEEYYSEQYSHGQGSSEPMNQQYYPDGNSPELESLRYWSRVDQHDCHIQGHGKAITIHFRLKCWKIGIPGRGSLVLLGASCYPNCFKESTKPRLV